MGVAETGNGATSGGNNELRRGAQQVHTLHSTLDCCLQVSCGEVAKQATWQFFVFVQRGLATLGN